MTAPPWVRKGEGVVVDIYVVRWIGVNVDGSSAIAVIEDIISDGVVRAPIQV